MAFIYLTLTWVKQHFEGEYLQRLNKLLDSNEFVNIQNVHANPTKKVQNAVLDFQRNLHNHYFATNPLGYLHFNRRRSMPTMYILRLKYVCYFTGPTVTIPFESKWCIKSVEKDTYIKKKEKSPVVSTNDTGLDNDDVLGNDDLEKRRSKPNHPWL
jgi:hypothetical protein